MDENRINRGVKKGLPWIARVLALIAIVAFFLPFCTISCSGQEIDRMSAAQIAAGKEVVAMGESTRVDGDPTAFVLILLPIVVIGISFVRKHIIAYITYICEAVSILLYNSYLVQALEKACREYNCTAHTEIGYVLFQLHGWLMIVIGVIGIVLTLVYEKRKGSSLDDRPTITPNKNDGCVEPSIPHKGNFASDAGTITIRSDGPRVNSPVNNIIEPDSDKVWRKEHSSAIEEHKEEKEKREKDLWNRPTGF